VTNSFWHRAAGWVTAVAILIGVVWTTYGVAERIGIRSLREATSHRLDIYSTSLQAEMKRFEYLPSVLPLNERLIHLLERPGDSATQDYVNRYLEATNSRAGAAAIYLIDRQGLTLAASNWNQAASFVNMNFAYRPYFKDGIRGLPGRFYGVGTVSREAGYYFAQAVMKDGVVLGVATVKVNLEKLDDAWDHDGEKILVADGNGVIFLSSEPTWKFRTLTTLSSETLGHLATTRQYTEAGHLTPLGLKEERRLEDGTSIVKVDAEPARRQSSGAGNDYMVHGSQVPGTDWRLIVMSELSPARAAARTSAAVAALICMLLVVLALNFQQRRRIVVQTRAAREALERANNELERKVEERTVALSDTNAKLEGEIAERKRAEETLRATLKDLVHTARMAVLGQMSAGITHELNQPLTALRTLSSATIAFLERGDMPKAVENLHVIAKLADHMGKITAQLKKSARKSAPDLRPVQVASVITDALFLLSQSARSLNVPIEPRVNPPDLQALCDANRLEQVLLNLLSNAIDATSNVPNPRILIEVTGDGEWVDLALHDSGSGVPEHVAAHLFEPFYSTKEQGQGLGLGLAISADIVKDLGGSLQASTSSVLGGALFTVRLRAAAVEPSYA
jgi:two-component system C4-dicarboxylate transport sensor histidine kinase DctB